MARDDQLFDPACKVFLETKEAVAEALRTDQERTPSSLFSGALAGIVEVALEDLPHPAMQGLMRDQLHAVLDTLFDQRMQ